MEITVMSFNIRYKNSYDKGNNRWLIRKTKFQEYINNYSPDIIGFQEVLAEPLSTLAEYFPDYDYVAVPREEFSNTESSPVFYRKDKFDLIDTGTFWLSETPEIISRGWDADCHRICTYVILKHKASGKIFTHLNTHLDHRGQLAQINGMVLILDKIVSLGHPAVLTGDFNAYEDSEVYLNATAVLKDTKYLSDSGVNMGTFNDFIDASLEGVDPIDFILVSSHFTASYYHVATEKIDNIMLSDHYAVIARISLN